VPPNTNAAINATRTTRRCRLREVSEPDRNCSNGMSIDGWCNRVVFVFPRSALRGSEERLFSSLFAFGGYRYRSRTRATCFMCSKSAERSESLLDSKPLAVWSSDFIGVTMRLLLALGP
jgi:hypothetical protein